MNNLPLISLPRDLAWIGEGPTLSTFHPWSASFAGKKVRRHRIESADIESDRNKEWMWDMMATDDDMPMETYHSTLMCYVSSIYFDFTLGHGALYCGAGQCVDMAGCIDFFSRQFGEVSRIKTFSGGKPDTTFAKIKGQWHAFGRTT